jgi:hypothetical protein
LTSVLDGDEWSASYYRRFALGEVTSGTHFIREWMGPRAGLEATVYRKGTAEEINFKSLFAFIIISTYLIII